MNDGQIQRLQIKCFQLQGIVKGVPVKDESTKCKVFECYVFMLC